MFKQMRAKRAVQKIKNEHPYLLECEAWSGFGWVTAKKAHPASVAFDAPAVSRSKVFLMPNQTINVVDTDFGNEYLDMKVLKWWVEFETDQTLQLFFETDGFPFEFMFIDSTENNDSQCLRWFNKNFLIQKKKAK
jgi:hypothetical protein